MKRVPIRWAAAAVVLFLFLLVVTLWSLRYTRITRGAFES